MTKILHDMYDFFQGNPVLNIISLLLGILGIILSFYFYKKSIRFKRPTYIVRTINLVRENLQKIETVEILYKGGEIKNLSITKIALWNEGKETIISNDVADNSPLKIRLNDDFEMLEAEVLYQKNSANDFKISVSEDRKSALINFDFFDHHEGAIFKIVHTANSSNDISITGSIKSVKEIFRKNLFKSPISQLLRPLKFYPSAKLKKRTLLKVMGITTIMFGIIMPILLVILKVFPKSEISNLQPKPLNSYILFVPFLIMSAFYISSGIRMLKRRIPNGFDIFDEEF